MQRLVQLPAGLGLLQQHIGQMGLGLTLHIGNLCQLLSPSDQEVGLLLARLAAGLKCPPSLFGLVAVLGHLRERDLEVQLDLIGIGETAVAAGTLFGEELRFGRDSRQTVVLLGMRDLALQLQVAAQIQGAPGLLQVRLSALGPALGGEVGGLRDRLFGSRGDGVGTKADGDGEGREARCVSPVPSEPSALPGSGTVRGRL